jgi:hypothetical protein
MESFAKTLGRNGWTPRTLALVLALALGAGAAVTMVPATAAAGPFPPPCNKYYSIVTYYSNASKTVVVGSCTTDGCDGLPTTCTGTKTSFLTLRSIRCSCDI